MAARTVVISTPGADPQFLHLSDGGLSRRGRMLAWALTAVLLLTGAATLTASGITPISGSQTTGVSASSGSGLGGSATDGSVTGRSAAHGSAVNGSSVVDTIEQVTLSNGTADTAARAGGSGVSAVGSTDLDDVIIGEWNGPTINLDWRGDWYPTVHASFVGDRSASPGDHVQRTLTIANGGPAAAVMSVDLLVSEDVPALAANPELAALVDVFWDVAGVTGSQPFASLLTSTEPAVAEVEVAQGETVTVTVGFTMLAEVTTGRGSNGTSAVLGFDVIARMTGDTTSEVLGADSPASGVLATTGAQLAGIALIMIGLLLAGWMLFAIARRRRRAD